MVISEHRMLVLMSVVQSTPTVVVLGQGYVGLPLAMAAVAAGHRVLGIDTNARRVEAIQRGDSPIGDVHSGDLKSALNSGRYSISDGYEELGSISHVVITVPTPLLNGTPDLKFIESAAVSLAPVLSKGCCIILESTTYPGTTEELLVPILEKGSGLRAGSDFLVGYSPERIDPGNPQWTLLNTPKIVSGVNLASLEAVEAFYLELGIPTVRVSGTRVAELTKLIENTFRHVNIALANELAIFSRALGTNIWEAIEAAATKPFGFMKFTPGPGVGGHCLPVDPSYLSWAVQKKTGSNFRFVEVANAINSYMPKFVAERALQMISELSPDRPARALLGGLAYKPDTADTREAPALAVASILSSHGIEVFAVDDNVTDYDWPISVARLDASSRIEFPIGIMLTAHSAFALANPLANCEKILDTQGILTGENVETL